MSVELGPTAARLHKIVEVKEVDRLNAALLRLNELYKLPHDRQRDPYRMSSLARHIEYLALALDVDQRTGEARRLKPQWTALCRQYEEFRKLLRTEIATVPAIVDNDLTGIAYFSTAKSEKPQLYASLVLFVANTLETEPKLKGYMQRWLPTSEYDLMEDIYRRIIENTIEEAPEGSSTTRYPYVRMNFAYDPQHRSMLDQFLSLYKADDGGARFICYRNGLVDPTNLVKSFLAIMPPDGGIDRDRHRFVHIYQAGSVGPARKISTGWAVPLREALYLVGGERDLRTSTSRAEPYRTVETIAIDWTSISGPDPILTALIMSSNYHHQPLVGRMALRATPIVKSDEFPKGYLDVVAVDALQSDLERDLAFEIEHHKKSFASDDAAKQARGILKRVNNCPNEWGVSGYYGRSGGGDNDDGITTSALDGKIETAFGSRNRPRYKAEGGEPFVLRDSVRFGCLSLK